MLPKPGDGYVETRREFIANYEDKEPGFKVYLRGKHIVFSPATVNRHFNIPTDESDAEFQEAKEMPDFYDRVLAALKIEEDTSTWTLKENGKPQLFKETTLKADAKLLLRFVKARIYPNTHTSEMYPAEAALVYAMLQGWHIDIGWEICNAISEASHRGGVKGLPFPSLITEICEKAHPTAFVDVTKVPEGAPLKSADYERFVKAEVRERKKRTEAREERDVVAQAESSRANDFASESDAAWRARMEQRMRRMQRGIDYNTRLLLAQMQQQDWQTVRERTPDTP